MPGPHSRRRLFDRALFRNNAIARRMIVALVLFSSAITAVITAVELYVDYRADIRGIDRRIESIRRVYLPTMTESVWVAEASQIQTQLDGLLNLGDIEYLGIVDKGEVKWSSGARKSSRQIEKVIPLLRQYRGQSVNIGDLHVVASVDNVLARIWSKLVVMLVSNGIKTVLVVAFVLLIFQAMVGQHLEHISWHLRRVGKDIDGAEDLRLDRPDTGRWRPDVLDHLTDAFNAMRGDVRRSRAAIQALNTLLEQRVVERTQELRASNAQLQEALATLERAQEELVRREKLAALGSMVAGVAHELNTPLGNSLTVATLLADKTREFAAHAKDSAQQPASVGIYLALAADATQLLTDNLLRAGDLIRNFRQVAVDQSSVQRRRFDLGTMVHEIIATLKPQFKANHHVEVDISEDVSIDSYPGPLAQVVANLVTNAMVHGLGDQAEGVVRIIVKRGGTDHACLKVEDSGKGITPEHLPRIFDPFFTTRLGQGGSGLGLYIAYNIATRILGGRIDVHSEPGKGSLFTLTIPLVAPAEKGNAGHWGAVET